MTDPRTDRPELDRQLRHQIERSRRALWAETLAAALWPAVSVLCLVLAAAVLGIFEGLTQPFHAIALVLAGLSVVVALVWGFRSVQLPRSHDAVARLDEDDPERPLATLTDRLAAGGGDATALALWRVHQERAAAAAAGLSARAPDLKVSSRDRWALRLLAPAVLAGAFVAAGDGWSDRLAGSLSPRAADALAGIPLADPAIEAWAVPPAYTRLETLYLNDIAPGAAPIELPQGTEFTLRVTGAREVPELAAEGLGALGGFRDLGGGLYEAVTTLETSGRVAVTLGITPMADWQIAVIPDAPPTVASTGTPGPDATQALEIPFEASDDYGVVAAWGRIELDEPAAERLPVEPIEFALPLPLSGDGRTVSDRAVHDFTTHPWAGARVVMTLHAEDGAGQIATAEPIRLTLPGRRFTDPLARALVDQRLQLIIDYARAEHALDTLQAVTRWPDEVFGDNAGAYLGVRTAIRRLAPSVVDERVPEVAPDVAEFLWQAALSLEDGDLSGALERLREAAERLRDALENGTEEEIQAAIDQLREAMNEYLAEMTREALQNPQAMQQAPQDGQQMTQQDLQEMLDQLQNQAEQGLRDQARDMLDQLAQMLENMRPGNQQQAGQSPGEQVLQQLQEMIQRQRNLSDQTFDELRQQRRDGQQGQDGQQQGQQGQQPGQMPGQQPGQQGQPGGQGGQQQGRHGENGRLAAEQEALRRAIEELRNQLGGGEGMSGAQRALEEAGRAMGEARDDLEGAQTGDAVQDQMDALDRLNEGAEALAQELQNGQGQQSAQGMRDGEGRADDRREADPFDRPAGAYGAIDGSGTDVPDQNLIDRARRLMEELRRRSADRTRPELELDYLRRLLEQF